MFLTRHELDWLYLAGVLCACLDNGCSTAAAPPPSPAKSRIVCAASSAVDVTHHTIELTLGSGPSSFHGAGEVRIVPLAQTRYVALDAHGLHVTRASVAGKALAFEQTDEQLCLELAQPLAAGTPLTLQFAWNVTAGRDSLHIADDQVWAGYDAAAWMPTRMSSEQRATLVLRIAGPRDWLAIASGAQRRREQAQHATQYTFAVSQPSPPFLFAFAAGRFELATRDVDGTRLRALGPAGADLAGALEITEPMLRFLTQRTGRALPLPEYTQVFVAGDAAQEAAGFALVGASALDDVRADPQADWVFLHELAHQWFGWLVPCADFNDFWLNEGFATFLVGAYKRERWGTAAYQREVAAWRERSARAHAQGRDAPLSPSAPGRPALPSPRDSELPARGVIYFRGALVLDKLNAKLGEDVFWRGIQRYVTDRAGKAARTEDLRAALEAVSGNDLHAFFARWVYAAAPDL